MKPVVTYRLEDFPDSVESEFKSLFDAHGMEARGRKFELNFNRYAVLQAEDRLVWAVARNERSEPVGYSGHYWFYDMHFGDKVAADDLWYVEPNYRRLGIGFAVRRLGLSALRVKGVTRTYDLLRAEMPAQDFMATLGYSFWGIRWVKEL